MNCIEPGAVRWRTVAGWNCSDRKGNLNESHVNRRKQCEQCCQTLSSLHGKLPLSLFVEAFLSVLALGAITWARKRFKYSNHFSLPKPHRRSFHYRQSWAVQRDSIAQKCFVFTPSFESFKIKSLFNKFPTNLLTSSTLNVCHCKSSTS